MCSSTRQAAMPFDSRKDRTIAASVDEPAKTMMDDKSPAMPAPPAAPRTNPYSKYYLKCDCPGEDVGRSRRSAQATGPGARGIATSRGPSARRSPRGRSLDPQGALRGRAGRSSIRVAADHLAPSDRPQTPPGAQIDRVLDELHVAVGKQ